MEATSGENFQKKEEQADSSHQQITNEITKINPKLMRSVLVWSSHFVLRAENGHLVCMVDGGPLCSFQVSVIVYQFSVVSIEFSVFIFQFSIFGC